MDVKISSKLTLPVREPKVEVTSKNFRMLKSSDRDANGQASRDNQEKPKRQLSETEFQAAVTYLENLPGIKNNGLHVRVHLMGERRFVLIEEPNGKVVRRIGEEDLADLMSIKSNDPAGHIYDRVT